MIDLLVVLFAVDIFNVAYNSYDESDIFDFKYCIVMLHDRLFIRRFTALILRSNNIDIVIDEKCVLCSNEIFASHIICLLYTSDAADE